MTSKEALEKTSTKQVAVELFNIVSNGKYDMNEIVPYFDRIGKALAELEELKRYPTADKVCETLSKHLKYIVTYYENAFEISYGTKNKEYVAYYIEYLGTKIEKILPPHLVTLIGRFYQSLGE